MLSKSKYLKGLQCEKRLWLDKHRPELRDAMDANQEALFAQGTSVGELAQMVFPNGNDATPQSYDWAGMAEGIRLTKEWVEAGVEVIYEAAVSPNGLYAAMDILVKVEGGYRAIEVKSSTGVKDYHINDGAVQYYALTQAGIPIVDIEIMFINNQYERDGEIDLQQLFTSESILDQILPMQGDIPQRIASFEHVLKQPNAPDRAIGPHCDDPFGCDFKGHCWAHIPEDNVFNLTRIGSKGWAMLDEGILSISDIPDDYDLSEAQTRQVRGLKYGEERFEAEEVSQFLAEWQYPLYFFDFETIGPAIPLYDHSRPYQQLPFQYSLHVLRTPGGVVEHCEFLADPNAGDPRSALTEQMIAELETEGSIVTYNMGFEKGKIADLAILFPEHDEALNAIIHRVVDLIVPFRKQWVYKPAMSGSASIKKVLPAMVPELSYKNLVIQEGGAASNTWQSMAEGTFEGDWIATMDALREYCKLDTLAMVDIYKNLFLKISTQ